MAKNKPVPDPAKVAQRKAERVAFVQSKPNLSPEKAREQFYVQTRAAELTAAGKAVDKKALRQKFETGGVTREGFYTPGDKSRIAAQSLAESKASVVPPVAPVATPVAPVAPKPGTAPVVPKVTPTTTPTKAPVKAKTPNSSYMGGQKAVQPNYAPVTPKAKPVTKPGATSRGGEPRVPAATTTPNGIAYTPATTNPAEGRERAADVQRIFNANAPANPKALAEQKSARGRKEFLGKTLGIDEELAKKTVAQIKQHGYDVTIGSIKPLAGLVNAPINAIGEGLNWLSGNGPDAGYNPHLYDPGLKENLKTAGLIIATEGLFGAGGGANAIANRIESAGASAISKITGSRAVTAAESLAYKAQGLPTPIKGLKPKPVVEAPVYGPPKPVGGLRAESLAEAKATAAPKSPAVGGLVDETTTASGLKIPSSKPRTTAPKPYVAPKPIEPSGKRVNGVNMEGNKAAVLAEEEAMMQKELAAGRSAQRETARAEALAKKPPAPKNDRFADAWDDSPVDMTQASGFDDMATRYSIPEEGAIEAPKLPRTGKERFESTKAQAQSEMTPANWVDPNKTGRPAKPAIEVKPTPAKPVVEIKTTKPPAPPTVSSAANLAEVKGSQPYAPQNPPRAWDPKNPWEHDPLSGSMTGGVEGFDPSMPRINRGASQQRHDTLIDTMRNLINSETTKTPLGSSFADQVDAVLGQSSKSLKLNALSKAESEAAITTANKNFEAAAPKNAANVKTVKLTPEEMEIRFGKKPKLASWDIEKDKVPPLRKPPKPTGKK